MGIGPFRRSSCKCCVEPNSCKTSFPPIYKVGKSGEVAVLIKKKVKKLPNPDPKNFIIDRAVSVRHYLVVQVTYPDCTNYEGKKIMVYRCLSIKALGQLPYLDPHFCDNGEHIAPIARFEPTEEGWNMAVKMCGIL